MNYHSGNWATPEMTGATAAKLLREQIGRGNLVPEKPITFHMSVGQMINRVFTYGRDVIEFSDLDTLASYIDRNLKPNDRFCITICSGEDWLRPSLLGLAAHGHS